MITAERIVLATGAVLALCTLVLVAWINTSEYAATRARATNTLLKLTTALEHDVRRNVEIYDLMVLETVSALSLPGLAEASPELREVAMFSHIAIADHLSRVQFTDKDGVVRASSDTR